MRIRCALQKKEALLSDPLLISDVLPPVIATGFEKRFSAYTKTGVKGQSESCACFIEMIILYTLYPKNSLYTARR